MKPKESIYNILTPTHQTKRKASRRGEVIEEAHAMTEARFRLWKHLHDEHGLTLLDSELSEIIDKVSALNLTPTKP